MGKGGNWRHPWEEPKARQEAVVQIKTQHKTHWEHYHSSNDHHTRNEIFMSFAHRHQ